MPLGADAAPWAYAIEQPLGPGYVIQVEVVAPGFADLRANFDLTNVVDGQPSNLGLAPLGGEVRIDPTEVHLNCSATFPVTITNVAADETLVILGITLHYHYGEGAYRFRRQQALEESAPLRLEGQGFYRRLLRSPFAQAPLPRATLTAVLVLISQIASALGFVREFLRQRCAGPQTSAGRTG